MRFNRSKNKRFQVSTKRQGIGVLSPFQQLVSPFIATVVPAAGATAIAIYGSYGEDLRQLYNSIVGRLVY